MFALPKASEAPESVAPETEPPASEEPTATADVTEPPAGSEPPSTASAAPETPPASDVPTESAPPTETPAESVEPSEEPATPSPQETDHADADADPGVDRHRQRPDRDRADRGLFAGRQLVRVHCSPGGRKPRSGHLPVARWLRAGRARHERPPQRLRLVGRRPARRQPSLRRWRHVRRAARSAGGGSLPCRPRKRRREVLARTAGDRSSHRTGIAIVFSGPSRSATEDGQDICPR